MTSSIRSHGKTFKKGDIVDPKQIQYFEENLKKYGDKFAIEHVEADKAAADKAAADKAAADKAAAEAKTSKK